MALIPLATAANRFRLAIEKCRARAASPTVDD
jgi:hypothetical protein